MFEYSYKTKEIGNYVPFSNLPPCPYSIHCCNTIHPSSYLALEPFIFAAKPRVDCGKGCMRNDRQLQCDSAACK